MTVREEGVEEREGGEGAVFDAARVRVILRVRKRILLFRNVCELKVSIFQITCYVILYSVILIVASGI